MRAFFTPAASDYRAAGIVLEQCECGVPRDSAATPSRGGRGGGAGHGADRTC